MNAGHKNQRNLAGRLTICRPYLNSKIERPAPLRHNPRLHLPSAAESLARPHLAAPYEPLACRWRSSTDRTTSAPCSPHQHSSANRQQLRLRWNPLSCAGQPSAMPARDGRFLLPAALALRCQTRALLLLHANWWAAEPLGLSAQARPYSVAVWYCRAAAGVRSGKLRSRWPQLRPHTRQAQRSGLSARQMEWNVEPLGSEDAMSPRLPSSRRLRPLRSKPTCYPPGCPAGTLEAVPVPHLGQPPGRQSVSAARATGSSRCAAFATRIRRLHRLVNALSAAGLQSSPIPANSMTLRNV